MSLRYPKLKPPREITTRVWGCRGCEKIRLKPWGEKENDGVRTHLVRFGEGRRAFTAACGPIELLLHRTRRRARA